MTTLPVIGVPIESKSLKRLDSLLSIVQMPGGIPVASMENQVLKCWDISGKNVRNNK